jgi:hypothetical protein
VFQFVKNHSFEIKPFSTNNRVDHQPGSSFPLDALLEQIGHFDQVALPFVVILQAKKAVYCRQCNI